MAVLNIAENSGGAHPLKEWLGKKVTIKTSGLTGKVIEATADGDDVLFAVKTEDGKVESHLLPKKDLEKEVLMNSDFNNFHIKENTLKNEEYLIEKVLTMGANKVSFLKGKDSTGRNIYAIQVNNSIEYDVTEPELKQLVLTLDAFVKRKI